MSGWVYCPDTRVTRQMNSCLDCQYVRRDDDVSNVWCRFTIGKNPENGAKIRAEIRRKQELAERYYKTGKPQIADAIQDKIYKLERKLEEM